MRYLTFVCKYRTFSDSLHLQKSEAKLVKTAHSMSRFAINISLFAIDEKTILFYNIFVHVNGSNSVLMQTKIQKSQRRNKA